MSADLVFWSSFVERFEAIPSTFWGVVLGSCLSLGGVVLSNRASDRRQSIQFEHEQRIKKTERELTLRKEIYLEASEAILAGINTVGNLANLDIDDKALTAPYTAKAAAFGKLNLIGNEDVIEAVTRFNGELAATMLQMSIKRFLLVAETKKIASKQLLLDKSLREQDEILKLMAQANIEGQTDERRFEALNEQFKNSQRMYQATAAEISVVQQSLYPAQLALMEETIEQTLRLGELLLPAVAAARRDLQIPVDEDRMRKVVLASVAKQKESLAVFTNQIRTIVAAAKSTPDSVTQQ